MAQYRIYIAAEAGKRKELVIRDYHFQVSDTSLAKTWAKARNIFRRYVELRELECEIDSDARQVTAAQIKMFPQPLCIGQAGTRNNGHSIYLQYLG